MADTNILQWDVAQGNIESDADYAADTSRTGGAPVDSLFPSPTANKLFYQLSTFIAAFCNMLATKGYSTSDANISALALVLANVMTNGEFAAQFTAAFAAQLPLAVGSGGTGAVSFSAAGLVVLSQLMNSPNTKNGIASSPSNGSTSPVLCPDLTYNGTFTGRKVCLTFSCEVSESGQAQNMFFQFYKDSSPIGPIFTISSPVGGQNESAQGIWFDLPTAAAHTYAVYWWVTGGTASASGTNRTLQVTEI